jgi:hypothetical protein
MMQSLRDQFLGGLLAAESEAALAAALVDWAVEALGAGYDSPALRILAGLLPPEMDAHTVVPYARRAAWELGMSIPEGEALRRAYIPVACRALLRGELDAETATGRIHAWVVSPLGHPADLMGWCCLWEGNSARCDFVDGPNTEHVIAEARRWAAAEPVDEADVRRRTAAG